MENTIFNIISQTVYGEVDLTVKSRIYLFFGKGVIKARIRRKNLSTKSNSRNGVTLSIIKTSQLLAQVS